MSETHSSRYASFLTRARAGQPILIDGATGSECSRRGVPVHEHGWSGGAALSHPDVVRSIHADYLAVGADFIAANTFATGRNITRDVGSEGTFEELNRRAVELAIEAREEAGTPAVLVAGGISNWSFSGHHPTLDQLREDTIAQAEVMRDAGADLLSLEMMVDLQRFPVTLESASSVGLPVWVGFSVGPEVGQDASLLGDDVQLREGGRLADGVALAAANSAVDAVCIMHTDVRLVERCVATIRDNWDGPIGAYGHASALVDGEITHDDVITPEAYAAYLPAWTAAGATMLGGCCGIGPDHLSLVATHLGR